MYNKNFDYVIKLVYKCFKSNISLISKRPLNVITLFANFMYRVRKGKRIVSFHIVVSSLFLCINNYILIMDNSIVDITIVRNVRKREVRIK